MAKALRENNNWIEVHTDYMNSIFLKNIKKNEEVISNLKPIKGSYYYFKLANEAFNRKDYQKAIELNKLYSN